VHRVDRHPTLRCVDDLERSLKDIAGVAVEFMSTADKREALLRSGAVLAQLESLRLRLVAASGDVADDDGCRDVATWLALNSHTDRSANARFERLAHSLDTRWPLVARALAEGAVHLDQAEVIVRSLEALPVEVPTDVLSLAESQLIAEAEQFGPRLLRVLGRRILEVVAPELGEDVERRLLEAEERAARRTTSLVTHRCGDGSTLIRIKVPDASADRLLTYVDAFASPRQTGAMTDATTSHDERLGKAFCSLLEALDPQRLPQHGGDGTSVVVVIDLASLRDGLGVASLGTETVITAGEARRLACAARIIPAVLGGDSEVLDLGRGSRLFSPAQRRALRLRDRVCRAQGCDVPAAWCEAHHFGRLWAEGGKTDLADGKLLCSWHHHRAHDERYLHVELPNGDVRFHRRR